MFCDYMSNPLQILRYMRIGNYYDNVEMWLFATSASLDSGEAYLSGLREFI
jgi:hypothetical protein